MIISGKNKKKCSCYNVTLNYSLKRSLHVCVLILTVILDTQRVREACSASSYKTYIYQEKEYQVKSQKTGYMVIRLRINQKKKHTGIWNDFLKYMRENAPCN